MKKIISLFAAAMMVLSVSVTSFASTAAPFSLSNGNLTVQDGTQEVVLNFDVEFETATDIAVFAFTVDTDFDNVTLTSVGDAFESYLPYNTSMSDLATGLVTYMNDDGASVNVPAGTITIPLTFEVNTSVASTFSVTFTSDTMLVDGNTGEATNDCATYPTATITVAAGEKDDPTVVESTKDEAGENDLVTKGYLVSATVTEDTKAINGITITASSNDIDKEVPYTFTTVTNGTVKVAVNVLNVPSTATVDFSYALSTVAE